MVLARLFQFVESGQLQAPIFDPASVPDPDVTNAVYVKQYTLDLLSNAFPHVQQ
jgi:exportin-1